MKMLKEGLQVEIPEGTWNRLNAEQKAQYTKIDGSEPSATEIETIKKIPEKKTLEQVAQAVAEKDDITGNPQPKTESQTDLQTQNKTQIKKVANKGSHSKQSKK